MQPKEWNPKGVLTVKHLNMDCDLISMRYLCKACKKSFVGSEERSVKTLPEFIRDQFPAELTKKKGYFKILSSIAAKCETSGMSVSGVNDMFLELAAERYDEQHSLYLASVDRQKPS